MSGFVAAAMVVAALASPPPGHGVRDNTRIADHVRITVPAADTWLGHDKAQHFSMSFATTAFAFGAATAAGMDEPDAMTAALGAAVVAGLGKEIFDRKRGRIFSARDLVADALGIAAAHFLLREVR